MLIENKKVTYTALPGLRWCVLNPNMQKIHADHIEKLVCEYYDIKVSAIKVPRRQRKLAFTRQVIMWLVRKYTKMTLSEIGARFNGKDHTTVIYAIRQIDNLIYSDERVRSQVRHLESEIQ
jgi:chromosomal replication initiator protein